MLRKSLLLLFIAVFHNTPNATAQETRWFKQQIATLSGPSMGGRGYVDKGRERAAGYIQRKFAEMGLQPAGQDSAWHQYYTFPVNTFPGHVLLAINGKDLVPGSAFLVDARSSAFQAEKLKVSKVDLARLHTRDEWEAQKLKFTKQNRAWVLKGTDSLCRRLSLRQSQLVGELPKGAYFVPVQGKMTWTVATDTIAATVFYVQDSVLGRKPKKTSLLVQTKYERALKSSNVIAKVTGTAVPDSFLVVSAHYDHLGKMGNLAVFPGASDNASGTAMLLYLASYYATHPQRYSILFIAFSGEEAGLKGSKYYTEHPVVPLEQMRFLINLDIMGDATDGVTVVNATEYPKAFSLLEGINKKKGYLPEIRSRGKAANSDHYFFSEAGVPAFFFYSNGGPGFYHDVFDKANTLPLTNIPQVGKLLIDFVAAQPGR